MLTVLGGLAEFERELIRTRTGEGAMKQQPIDEQAAREALPTETKRNFGLPTAGVIALVVVGTAIYWIS